MIHILNRKPQNRGFTLLEIVISLGLMTIALLAVFRLQAQNLDFQSEAQFITIAKHLAQDRISQIQAGGIPTEGTSSGDFPDDFSDFSFREEISTVLGMDDLFEVRISITLKQQELTRDLSVETFLFRHKI